MLLYVTVILCWSCILECESLLYPVFSPEKNFNYTPPEDEVTFHLYHYSDLSRSEQLFPDNYESIWNSKFDPELETKFLTHGWTHGKDAQWLIEMREVMANTRQWNIIVIDWESLARVMYIEARLHSPVVSKQLAQMLLTLKRCEGIHFSSVHIIGHSLGAQIAAFAGLKVKQIVNESVGRITGLDPAAPLFEWPHMEYLDEVLDPTDADFVDVIHTNGRLFGFITPMGHVDYYVNGGENQVGCISFVCSHLRAVEYWIASIRKPDLFKAYPFEEWDEYVNGHKTELISYPMGILANKNMPSGTYYVKTDEEFLKYINSSTTLADSFL